MKNGTKIGRVCFRGLQLPVPEEASFETGFVQCGLVPDGLSHTNNCASSLKEGDPAHGLGIKVKFKSELDNKRDMGETGRPM